MYKRRQTAGASRTSRPNPSGESGAGRRRLVILGRHPFDIAQQLTGIDQDLRAGHRHAMRRILDGIEGGVTGRGLHGVGDGIPNLKSVHRDLHDHISARLTTFDPPHSTPLCHAICQEGILRHRQSLKRSIGPGTSLAAIGMHPKISPARQHNACAGVHIDVAPPGTVRP